MLASAISAVSSDRPPRPRDRATSSIRCQQPAADAGALSRRIDGDLVDVEPSSCRSVLTTPTICSPSNATIDVAALQLRHEALPLRQPSRSGGGDLAPQGANIGREGRAQDALDIFALGRHRLPEGQRHGRRIAKQKRPPAWPAGVRSIRGEEAYAASCCSACSADGPLSWPLAAVSRSTNSITAIGAASPKRKPAFRTRR